MSMFKRKDPSQLQAQLDKLKGGSSFSAKDEGMWKIDTDAQGNGSAVIRFLPAKGDGLPFIKLVNHGFKKNGKWYIENCTSTHGDFDSCPVCQHISKNDSYNTNKEEYGLLKRKTSYYANVLVIKDPKNPGHEGKVFKFRFGQKIMDKISAMVAVDTDIGEEPIDVTCPFEGANFLIKVEKVGGFQNYDKCKFASKSEIADIDNPATQEYIETNSVDLSTLTDKSQFKSFEENEKKFKQVYGGATSQKSASLEDELGAMAGATGTDDGIDGFDSSSLNQKVDSTSSTGTDDGELDDLLAGL